MSGTTERARQEYHVILTILGRDGLPETYRDRLLLDPMDSDHDKLDEFMVEKRIWPHAPILFYRIAHNWS